MIYLSNWNGIITADMNLKDSQFMIVLDILSPAISINQITVTVLQWLKGQTSDSCQYESGKNVERICSESEIRNDYLVYGNIVF